MTNFSTISFYIRLLLLICHAPLLFAIVHDSSYPYISGDTFRAHCDYIFDNHTSFNPDEVKDCATIFVKTEYLEKFFAHVHPRIAHRYILITHNSDFPSPGPFKKFLEEKKLIAWFGENCSVHSHPKFFPLPIGLANGLHLYNDTKIIEEKYKKNKKLIDYKHLVYLNFTRHTTIADRVMVYDMFKTKKFVTVAKIKNYRNYLEDMQQSAFTLSPRGGGLDCYRTWEALLVGSIPIVKKSTLDPLYKDLPVLIVNYWHEITDADYLIKKFKQIRAQPYHRQKLYFDYWWNQIKIVQQKAKDLSNEDSAQVE